MPRVEELAGHFGTKLIFLRIVEDVMMLGYDAVLDISMHQQDHDQRKKEAKSYLAGLDGVFKEKKCAKNIISFGPVV